MRQRFSKQMRFVSGLLTAAMVFTFLPFSALAAGGTHAGSTIELSSYYFPDDAFREYLKTTFDKSGDKKLQPAERNAVKEINVSGKNISNLYGIQFFPNLNKLDCSSNQLTILDVHENTALQELSCSENRLTSLDVSQNAALQGLYCYDNELTKLDVRQNTALVALSCSQNRLTELDVRQNPALDYLSCYKNSLSSLDVSQNAALQELSCENNQLTELDVSQNAALRLLRCDSNRLTSLDVTQNTALTGLTCEQNKLSSLDVSQNTALVSLYCNSNQLSSLDVTKNTKLKFLHCDSNQLTELDVRQNPALYQLYCSNNQLTELDVRNNTRLEKMYCDNNRLSSLNLECEPIYFSASGNEYSVQVYESTRTFDLSILPGTFNVTKTSGWVGGTVSGNTLKVNTGTTQVTYTYDCGKGFSTDFTLNVTVVPDGTVTPPSGKGIRIYGDNFPNYEFRQYLKANIDKDGDGYLNDTELNIRKLDVSGQHIANLKGIEFFPNLETLDCHDNKLTSLDVSKNPELKELKCYNNKLTSLDVSKNEKLETLYCSKNQLTSLDVSKNTALKYLWCSQNNLTSLDVTQNTALEDLSCYDNQLTSLDVSKNPALEWLMCFQNKLTKLDVSKNTALKYLDCKENNLTSLDVNQTAVTTLDASDNKIDINVETTPRTFDLSTLPGFDVTKASGWVGGTVDGSTLKVDAGATQVTYTYDCGKGRSIDFTLNVKVVPDSTVTPPSGGEGTGTTTPPSGGEGTGTTTPPSGGGTGTTTPPSGGGTGTTTPPSGGGTGTTTPPSGGEGTGTTTPPSGGGTGTTTPPSGGGTGTTTPPSGGEGTGTTTPPSGGDGGGGAIVMVAGAAVAGVVGYGVYNYVSGQKLQALLPEGVVAPENRAQTALLLWNTAGRPEPAETPAFADVADPDTAKAAQWCVEQGLMKRRLNGKFAPDSNIPAYQVLNAYRKLAG